MPRFRGAMTRSAWLIASCLVLLLGCQSADDPAIARHRTKYLLSEEPPGAIGVLEARAQIAKPMSENTAPSGSSSTPIVLVGRIGAGPHATWDPGRAAFVITDPAVAPESEHAHEAGHDPENCPFCKAERKKTADTTALVQVVDEQGQVLGVDARKLFSIEEDQLVVVRGNASIDALGNLVVAASGIYPRR
jgi:hypothetical protein